MAIEHIVVYLAPDSSRREFVVGECGVQWVAVDSTHITVDREHYTQVFPMTSVVEYIIWKRGK
jgi:hypothetical protein